MEPEEAGPGGVGLTLKCPRGEEWPATSFKSFVDIRAKPQTHDTITFLCPADHQFTLRRAVRSRMLTPEQALKILAEAERQLPTALADVRRVQRDWRRQGRERAKGDKRDGA